ncbi:MAG TPA: M48 family metallopeptidase [Candidatus Omnitrophota bacterium]|nr:M48 family metallopeptidase [Candidatus Omnitrophota bacterium]
MDKSCFKSPEEKAGYYSRIRYCISIGEAVFFLMFCVLWHTMGVSARLSGAIETMASTSNPFVAGPVFLACFSLVYYILSFPAVFYRNFLLEHQFGLSNQSVRSFFFDQVKAGLLAFSLSAAGLLLFYFLYTAYPLEWWIYLTVCWIALNTVMAYLVPLVVVPMFFKYTRFPEGPLRQRISGLAQAMGIRLLEIYHIDFSRRTVKANAGLMGLGNSKRVVLSDTVQKSFTDEEIAAIVAHEFAHSRNRHMPKLMLASSVFAALLFYAAFRVSPAALSWVRVRSWTDPAAIPVILCSVFLAEAIVQPLINALSRRFESEADTAAIQATGSADSFITAMEKLAARNLSDPKPPALLVWLFYSHPPVSERIARARAWQGMPGRHVL